MNTKDDIKLDLDLMADLTRDEDLRDKPYDDATGKELAQGDVIEGFVTIGVGWNLAAHGLPRSVMMMLLQHQIDMAQADLTKLVPNWRNLPYAVQRGLVNMSFNLGYSRLSQFKKMLSAIRVLDFKTAATEALDSKWAKQVGPRAERIADLFRNAT